MGNDILKLERRTLRTTFLPTATFGHIYAAMEDDRAEGNLGIAADLEVNQEPVVQRQPKKRFVGRRQAAENAAKGGVSDGASIENAVQGEAISYQLKLYS